MKKGPKALAAAALAVAAAAGCRDLDRSNCDVVPANFQSANYAAYFNVFHSVPERCPVNLTSTTRSKDYAADIFADPDRIEWVLNTSFFAANRYYDAAHSRGDNFFYNNSTGNIQAQVRGSYYPGLAGCTFQRVPQADYARTSVPLKAWVDIIGAEVILTYNYSDGKCGQVAINANWEPYNPITVYASAPSDASWQEPTTYEWTLNGSPLEGEHGSTVTRSGFGPGQQAYFEVTMRDAAGQSVYGATGGTVHNYGSCDPTVIQCNDQ